VKNITYIIRPYASKVNEDRLRRRHTLTVTGTRLLRLEHGNMNDLLFWMHPYGKRFFLTLWPFSFLISLLCKFFHSILLFTTFITLGACTQALIALNKAKAMGAKAHGFFSQ
jgi:hypothetical protein